MFGVEHIIVVVISLSFTYGLVLGSSSSGAYVNAITAVFSSIIIYIGIPQVPVYIDLCP